MMIVYAVVAFVVVLLLFILYKYFSGKKDGEMNDTGIVLNEDTNDNEEERGAPMTIVYGSQSGTAENFAFELQKEAKKYKFNCKVYDLEEYEHESDLPDEKFIVFLMATFGEGEPTDNAVNFWEWLTEEDHEDDEFEGVEFATFALGNRQYEFFANVGQKVAKLMKKYGGTEILECGIGDDDGTLDEDYAEWKDRFWKVARQRYTGESGDDETDSKFEGSWNIEWSERSERKSAAGEPAVIIDPKHDGSYIEVLVNRELRQDITDGGSTRHIEVDISNARFNYNTADNLGVQPRNDYDLTIRLAKRLGVKPNQKFILSNADPSSKRKPPYPKPCSVLNALLWYCEFTHIPKLGVLKTLLTYAEDDNDKQLLQKYISHDGHHEFQADMKSLLEVLEEVPSVNPPFEHFLEWCPKIQPRFYTISSSSVVHPKTIHITVSQDTHKKPRNRVHQGVCSTYLCQLKPKREKIAAFVRKSAFVTPWIACKSSNVPPCIMVGPGTGIAPFRAFLQEVDYRKNNNLPVGKVALFFGCKKRDWDYIYRDELTDYDQRGVIDDFIMAFSRETKQKVYVQHRMKEKKDLLWDYLYKEKGYFYVCGGTSMGRDVRNTIIEIAQSNGGMSNQEAEKYLHGLQNDGRFIQELWS